MATDSEPEPEPPRPALEVIGAGFGRTGTYSLKEALTILGYKPYHFVTPQHAELWAAHAEGRLDTEALLSTLLPLLAEEGYTATLENPSADLYRELASRFPSSLVVLSVRDSGAKWEASWKLLFDTMQLTERPFSLLFPSFFQWIPLFRHLKTIRTRMGTQLGLAPGELTHGWRRKPDGWLATQYERHVEQVRNTIPADRLLVFNVKEGWEPLCKFLGKPVPKQAFPRSTANDAKALRRLRLAFLGVTYAWIPAVALCAYGVARGLGLGALWNRRR
mmetsp:Transcript_8101/g.15030  ORF Transcript_8101/g.15030 Transcript_8101/m.15030 type:complete len:276 (-) Transcript_8101:100-927(-)